MKVLILSHKDFSGSGYKLAQALIKRGIDARVVVAIDNKKYPKDYVIGSTKKDFIQEIADRSDIIHFKGDDVPTAFWNDIDVSNKRTICTVAGSGFRRHGASTTSYPFAEIDEYKTMIKTAFTPDLVYNDDWVYTPQTIDSGDYSYNYKGKHLIQHSPSAREKKGTDAFILPAIELLKKKYDFDFELLEGLSNEECCERKKRGTIFIDQVCDTGWYGISALESMRYGIPVVAHMSEEAIKSSKLKSIAVVNVDKSIQSVYNELEKLLKTDCNKLSKDTYKYFMDTHSNESVADRFIDLYESMLKRQVAYLPIKNNILKEVIMNVNNVLVEWIKDISAGGYNTNKIGEVEVLPIGTAKPLMKRGFIKILNYSDMIKVRLTERYMIEGELKEPGDIVFVNYEKAVRLEKQNILKILKENVEQTTPKQPIKAEVVPDKAAPVEKKATRKPRARKTVKK